jgi:hypothetical protein
MNEKRIERKHCFPSITPSISKLLKGWGIEGLGKSPASSVRNRWPQSYEEIRVFEILLRAKFGL